MMKLKEIYEPIKREMDGVDRLIHSALNKTDNKFISRLNDFLLESPGKRVRPALVILSCKASPCPGMPRDLKDQLTKIGAGVELIHMASLLHDDVIDYARLRHNKPTVNYKWGADVAITLGDYLYSAAFDLISTCRNIDILQCISSATKAMCEGELFQVCERDNLDLLKEQYFLIVKKKTASLFAASCQAGAMVTGARKGVEMAFKEYGMNLGISFQIIDDYLDLAAGESELGKAPGQDIGTGEITLPLLYILESGSAKKEIGVLKQRFFIGNNKNLLQGIRSKLSESGAGKKTLKTVSHYINLAKEKVSELPASPYKESLLGLSDFVMYRGGSIAEKSARVR